MFTPTRRLLTIVLFVAFDVIAVGTGMGVPVFAIALGFPVGWFLPGFLRLRSPYTSLALRALLRASLLTSAVTLVVVAVIWLPTLRMLADPAADLTNFGIPMILYEPLASFIGWVVLMVLISPALQMLATLFASVLRCAFRPAASSSIAVA
jgi:hypothetical protein